VLLGDYYSTVLPDSTGTNIYLLVPDRDTTHDIIMWKYYPSLAKYHCAAVLEPEEYTDWVLLNDTDYLLVAQFNSSGTETDIYGMRVSKHYL
jgi:hypothetical protein